MTQPDNVSEVTQLLSGRARMSAKLRDSIPLASPIKPYGLLLKDVYTSNSKPENFHSHEDTKNGGFIFVIAATDFSPFFLFSSATIPYVSIH